MIVQAVRRLYRRQFPRRPRPPLAQACWHADQIVALLYLYWRDQSYRPTEAEIRRLWTLQARLSQLGGAGSRLIFRLQSRSNREPEVSKAKWLR